MFRKKGGGVIQLVDKEKMKDWPVELPLIFIEYIREKKLDTYEDNTIKKGVESYLDEIMKEIAIPRLISVLDNEDDEEIIPSLTRILDVAKKNIDLVIFIWLYLVDLQKSKNKKVVELSNKISEMFVKAERRKELVRKRKVMRQKEKEFLDGKITAQDYAKIRKEYLLLKE